jgi:hypothetical protein
MYAFIFTYFRSHLVILYEAMQEAIQKNTATCMVADCESEAIYARGCCAPCYGAIRTEVQSGRVTWKQLEEANKCLPARGKIRRHLADII